MAPHLSRRDTLRFGAGCLVAGSVSPSAAAADDLPSRPFLTPADEFTDVSRGTPIPHTLSVDALVKARLTPETWRLEIVAEGGATIPKPRRVADGTALDYPALLTLGETRGVRFLKAMQCNNIALPLGQGLWEGVPLRDVLEACGPPVNARRLFYWGYHNDDPKQIFRSSLAMNQVLDAPPGELLPFVAYKLNGLPIPLVRGGPVRMVVPWAHGFKSVKWLQHIVLTNSYAANDTYAEKNNDPESYLKTAAYFDKGGPAEFRAGRPAVVRGTAMVGWPGLDRVEAWVRSAPAGDAKLADDDPAWAAAEWLPGRIDPPPADWDALPDGVLPKDVWGFTPTGKPKTWPPRYSVAHWTVTLPALTPGKYELRVRTVDANGVAQPGPRPNQRSGKNLVPVKVISVA